MIIPVSYDDDLRDKFVSIHDVGMFSNVQVEAPQNWCYDKSCNHSHEDYDDAYVYDKSVGGLVPNKDNPAMSCSKRNTTVAFYYKDSRFRIETRCLFDKVSRLMISSQKNNYALQVSYDKIYGYFSSDRNRQLPELADLLASIKNEFVSITDFISKNF